jgi:ribA/ribD-fused uncharacterized protein
MVIRFYRELHTNGYLSNSSRHPVELDGLLWPTSEHYYQAQKHAQKPLYMEAIRATLCPESAKNMGRQNTLRDDWDDVKDDVMRKVVLAKFTQHPDLTEKLLATGSDIIMMDSPKYSYWGCGADGDGENKLGRILMEVRSVIGLAKYFGPDVLHAYVDREF